MLKLLLQTLDVLDVVDRRARDLDQVDETPGVDLPAGAAFAAGTGSNPALAVETLGEDARNGGLAHPALGGAHGQNHTRPVAGVGIKVHDDVGRELAVVTDEAARGHGLARRLVGR